MVFKLREARRAMDALSANPDDTAAAIRAITAMSGNSGERCFRRFKRSATGARILQEKRELADALADIDRLGMMPHGSLGKEIWNFYTVEQLSIQGLQEASEAAQGGGSGGADTDEARFGRRLRDLHDVFHVLTGYGRDILGEIACLAFTYAQTRNTGVGYVVLRALRQAGWRSEMGRLCRQAYRRGRHSRWLVDLEWETLLDQPLEQLRLRLGVGPAPVYEQIRSAGAPVLQ
jgi:ubiquinone biosynthesis protein COQ4